MECSDTLLGFFLVGVAGYFRLDRAESLSSVPHLTLLAALGNRHAL